MGSSHPKIRQSQTPLLEKKVPVNICGKFLVFPSVIKRRAFSLPKGYQHESMEVKLIGVTNQEAEMVKLTWKSKDIERVG